MITVFSRQEYDIFTVRNLCEVCWRWYGQKLKSKQRNQMQNILKLQNMGFCRCGYFEFYHVAVKLFHKIPSSHHNLLDHPLPPRPVGDTSWWRNTWMIPYIKHITQYTLRWRPAAGTAESRRWQVCRGTWRSLSWARECDELQTRASNEG